MKSFKKGIKKLITFAKKNYIIILFGLIIFFVGCVILFKFLTQEKETVYVKVKVSQGLWWASTLKPSIWLADSLQKGDVEVNLSGKPIVEILEVRKYPLAISYSAEQYEVFLTVKLKANYNANTQKYSFKRSNLTIGGPIEFEFQNSAITGTVTDISDKPIENQYEEKIVTLQKEFAQEWEYDAIIEGDIYSDGEEIIIEVLGKNVVERYDVANSLRNNFPVATGRLVNITTTLKMKLKKQDNTYLFREELPIVRGRRINLSLANFVLNDFVITGIE